MSKTTLSARERIACLLDDASFVEIGGHVTSRGTDFNLNAQENPGDGVITGYGSIDSSLVYVYSQDAGVLGGSVGEMHAKKITHLYDMAMKVGAPIIGFIDCAGLRLQEATDSLNSFGEIFAKQTLASGMIPQLTAVVGTCGGGSALIPALSDITVIEQMKGRMFVNSPNALEGNRVSSLDTADARYLAACNGQIDYVAENEEEMMAFIRQVVSLLPSCWDDNTTAEEGSDDLNRIIPELEQYGQDAKIIFSQISDDHFFLELKQAYGTDMVIGFARLNGMTVGCVGSQFVQSKGRMTTAGMQKAADFVRLCDAFSIPVLTLSNVTGFRATIEEERTTAKAAADLSYAFTSATVPKVTLITGDAFGTPYIIMNSKAIGADVVYAWPQARIGMMDPEQAVRIMYAGEIAEAEEKLDLIEEQTRKYNDLQSSAKSAAKRGYVDDIIEPDATRKRLITSFEMLYAKRIEQPKKKRGTK